MKDLQQRNEMGRLFDLLIELRQMFRSRYVRALEHEVQRLRAENCAMMNSLLGTAGVPPLQFPEIGHASPRKGSERPWRLATNSVGAWHAVPANAATSNVYQATSGLQSATVGAGLRPALSDSATGIHKHEDVSLDPAGDEKESAPLGSATPPLRRRSWQQIGRMLEIEEARREREHSIKMTQVRMRPEALAAEAQENGSGKPNGRVRDL